jgi:CubicO group peptidase (beta-lactamase class C family)
MPEVAGFDAARAIVARGIQERVFPAAAFEVGASAGTLDRGALGTLTFDPDAQAANPETVFDLGSLTKPIATTSLILRLVNEGTIRLDEPLGAFFSEWVGTDREAVTVRDCLEHASGLSARLIDAPPAGRREFEHEICRMPLEYVPRSHSIYSDLGFILLGFAAEDRGGASLGLLFDGLRELALPRTSAVLTFNVGQPLRPQMAPTAAMEEDLRRGQLLVGGVHDNYAAALGGAAGHAGLFGTVGGVGALARLVLLAARGLEDGPPPFTSALTRLATTKTTVPGSSRALGWDTMLPTSSCGRRMSASAFGHVSFTGTSLWIDPARDRYFVLLTNRACRGGTLEQMRDVRRAFHDALAA